MEAWTSYAHQRYPPFRESEQKLSTCLGIYNQIDEMVDTIAKTVDNALPLSGRTLFILWTVLDTW